jgi:hypothetical protein
VLEIPQSVLLQVCAWGVHGVHVQVLGVRRSVLLQVCAWVHFGGCMCMGRGLGTWAAAFAGDSQSMLLQVYAWGVHMGCVLVGACAWGTGTSAGAFTGYLAERAAAGVCMRYMCFFYKQQMQESQGARCTQGERRTPRTSSTVHRSGPNMYSTVQGTATTAALTGVSTCLASVQQDT